VLDPGKRLVRRGKHESVVVDGEAVLLSIEGGSYYGTNSVGTRVWELLAEPRSLNEVCAVLGDEFDVDGETCRREISAFVQELLREKLIEFAHPDTDTDASS
jgi:hypothetical protein